ncbi:MAG TPA: TIGR01777 family protein, partial [Planctomycetaceae bacterium]|nr:TIGR01777 family protein [Planctomycetaceae bacterium]
MIPRPPARIVQETRKKRASSSGDEIIFSIFCHPAGCPDGVPAVIAYRETTGTLTGVDLPVRLSARNRDPNRAHVMSQILISGASGMVGQALCASLESDGHQVIRLVRNPSQLSETGTVLWSPVDQAIDGDTLKSHGRLDAVVHLAGEGIAAARWSTTQKARIRDSRIVGTRLLANTIAGLPEPPGTLVSASAIGFYGDRGDDWVEESDQPGDMFLSDLCRDWESETDPARQAGIRVVNHRIGVVLSKTGGALQKMLLPFKLGFGGRVGSGRQFWSWIT